MNLNNIKAGDVFKNYKELCKALNVPEKSGKSKYYQLEKFSSEFSFHREGRAYVIDDIGKKLVFDTRGGSASKEYTRADMFVDLLTIALSNQKENRLLISTRNLIELCGFVNSDFFKNHDSHNSYSKKHNFPDQITKDVFIYSNRRLYSEVNKNLKNLEKKRLIRLNKTTLIEGVDGVIREASKNEVSILMDAENYSLNKLCISDFYKIGFKWNEFVKYANEYAREHGISDLVKYYNMKEIILATETLKVKAEESKTRLIKSQLNTSILVSFQKGIKNRRYTAIKEHKEKTCDLDNCGFGIDVDIKKNSLEKASKNPALHENYVQIAQKILADNIIIKNLDDITELENETKIDITLNL